MSHHSELGGHGLGGRIEALELGWRGAVLRALRLNGQDLQLLSGALDRALTASAGGLGALADRVPGDAQVAHLPGPGRLSPTFSDGYRRLLGALRPETETGLHGLLGASYPSWVAFRNAARADIPQRRVFGSWARARLDPALRRAALQLFDSAAQDPVSLARDAFGQARFRHPRMRADSEVAHVPGFGLTPERVARSMFPLRDALVRFDSAAMRGGEAGALRPASLPGAALLGGAGDRRGRDPLERRIALSRITVEGRIAARGVVPVEPEGWCDPAILQRAVRAGSCAEVWDGWSATGRWGTFFGPGGLLSRHIVQLVMVAGVTLTLRCHGAFDVRDQALLADRIGLRAGAPGRLVAPGGVWPLRPSQGAAAMRARLSFDEAGTLQLDAVQEPGTVQCWGARLGYLTVVP